MELRFAIWRWFANKWNERTWKTAVAKLISINLKPPKPAIQLPKKKVLSYVFQVFVFQNTDLMANSSCYKGSNITSKTIIVGWTSPMIPHDSWRLKSLLELLESVMVFQMDVSKNRGTSKSSGQIIIFHQPGFPWNKGISLTKPPFGVRSCEVAIIWPEIMHLFIGFSILHHPFWGPTPIFLETSKWTNQNHGWSTYPPPNVPPPEIRA